jgi:hypothetical protein
MMRREELSELLAKDKNGLIIEHYTRMVRLRLRFDGIVLPGMEEGKVWMPECHTVARAYSMAFGLPYVDGMFTYISAERYKRLSKKPIYDLSSYAHSWNVVEIEGERVAILDMFPDIGASMMPILMKHPAPMYGVPEGDPIFKREIEDKLLVDPDLESDVELVAAEFRRLEARYE